MKAFIPVLVLSLSLLNIISCAARFTKAPQQAKRAEQPSRSSSSGTATITSELNLWLGVPYRYGGNSRQGIDCSALTGKLYQAIYGVQLPRTALEQMRSGRKVSPALLRKGDLLFFKNSRGKVVDHVGFYLGDDRFVHASRQKGVAIARFSADYYQKHFVQARRIIF